MRKFKKMMAGVLAAASVFTCMAIYAGAYGTAQSYSLRYSRGGPSESSKLSQTISLTKTSGTEDIKIVSTKFSPYVKGMYLEAKCTSNSTNTAIINTTGNYYLVYNQSIPLTNKTVTVSITAKDYVSSETFTATGTVQA